MKRVLMTGMSGTGKSTLVAALARLGYKAIDADTAEYSEWVEVNGDDAVAGTPVEENRDWVWRDDRIARLLATEDTSILFLSGCAANMRKFLPQFDTVILLSAAVPVIVERLASRTTNDYGKRPEEVERVLSLKQTVEPLLRKAAEYEIDTGGPARPNYCRRPPAGILNSPVHEVVQGKIRRLKLLQGNFGDF